MRSGAIQRVEGETWGMMLRQRYEEAGLPWRNTTGGFWDVLVGSVSTYAIEISFSRLTKFIVKGKSEEISWIAIVMFLGTLFGEKKFWSEFRFRKTM